MIFRWLLSCLVLLSGTIKAETLVFSEFDYINRMGNPEDQVWYEIIEEAVFRIGYDFEVKFESGQRPIHDALSGLSDGLLFQSQSFKELFPDLIQVEYQLSVVPLYLYAIDKPPQLDICNDNVGMLEGFDNFAVRLSTLFQCEKPIQPHYGSYMRQMIMMMQAERLDWLVAPVMMEPLLNAHVEGELYRLQASEIKIPVYMYLSAHNKHLAVPLAEAIQSVYNERGIDNQGHYPIRIAQ